MSNGKTRSAPARRHVIRQSPNPIIASKTPPRANRPRRPIHRRSLAFRQRPFFDQHHTRPAPGAKLHAVRLGRDEKASSGLSLKPTDLPSLLTEQRAHFSPLWGLHPTARPCRRTSNHLRDRLGSEAPPTADRAASSRPRCREGPRAARRGLDSVGDRTLSCERRLRGELCIRDADDITPAAATTGPDLSRAT